MMAAFLITLREGVEAALIIGIMLGTLGKIEHTERRREVWIGVIAAIEKGRPQQRYIIAGDNLSVRDLLLAVSSILGKMPHLVEPPRSILNASSRLASLLNGLRGGGKRCFYPDLVRLLDYDWAYSSMKARNELGYTNRSVYVTLSDLLHNNLVGTYQKPAQLRRDIRATDGDL